MHLIHGCDAATGMQVIKVIGSGMLRAEVGACIDQ